MYNDVICIVVLYTHTCVGCDHMMLSYLLHTHTHIHAHTQRCDPLTQTMAQYTVAKWHQFLLCTYSGSLFCRRLECGPDGLAMYTYFHTFYTLWYTLCQMLTLSPPNPPFPSPPHTPTELGRDMFLRTPRLLLLNVKRCIWQPKSWNFRTTRIKKSTVTKDLHNTHPYNVCLLTTHVYLFSQVYSIYT